MSRIKELFEDDKKQLSMTRLLTFMSFFPASWVVIETQAADTLGWYLGAFAGAYVGGKLADKLGGAKTVNVDNVENAETLTQAGDVNVNSRRRKK